MPSSPRTALALATAAAVVAPALWGITAATGEPSVPLERAAIAEIGDPAPPVEAVIVTGAVSVQAFAPMTTTTVPAPATTTTVPVATTVAPTTASPAPAPTTSPQTTTPPETTTTTAPPPEARAVASNRDLECESSMLTWMNETRSEAGVGSLLDDPAIKHVPVDWSQVMADRSDLAHNPDYGPQVFAARPEARTAAENVGWSRVSARAIYDEFLRSAPHRDTILRARLTHSAVGCVRDADGALWVAVNFWG